jgi:hypothetical protein
MKRILRRNLTIVVRRSGRAFGRILARGAPVIGAQVLVIPADRNFVTLAEATTDSAGRFNSFLPPGAKDVDILVTAGGLPTQLAHRRLDGKEITVHLGTVGGELELTVPLFEDAATAHPWIVHDGAISHVRPLLRTVSGSGPLVIDAGSVDPGAYTLCLATRTQLPLLRAGRYDSLPCQSGIVPPYGKLSLAVSPTK